MWANISAVIQFLPKLIDMLDRLGKLIKEKQLEAWVNDLQQTIEKAEKAQTPDDKRAVARDLVGLVRRL